MGVVTGRLLLISNLDNIIILYSVYINNKVGYVGLFMSCA